MKKSVLMFLALFLVPSVLATISVNGPDRSQYNLGDRVEISGYISQNKAVSGFLNLDVVCGNESFSLPIINVNLAENEKKVFPGDINLPSIIVSSSMSGSCNIRIGLMVNDEIIEEADSDTFIVTKELDGNFNVDKNKVQAGMPVIISGEVYKLNGENIGGSIELYLRSENKSYLVDVINTADGKFNYEYMPIATIEGIYDLDLVFNDIYGNRHMFSKIASIELVNEYDVFIKIEKTNYMPSERVDLEGEVVDILGGKVKLGDVYISLDDNNYKTTLKDGIFSYSFIIPADIKSGKHEISISVEDNYGNSGEKNLSLYVNPLADRIAIELKNKNINPGEDVEVITYLYDQAGDIIAEDISVEVLDPSQNSLFSDIIKSGSKAFFKLSKFAQPGFYTITTRAIDLEKKDKFSVDSVVKADVTLSNQTVYIKNVGNVDYKKPVKFDFNNGEYNFMKQLALKPEESAEYYLEDLDMPTGMYTLNIKYGEEVKNLGQVEVVGKSKNNFNYSYILYPLLAVGLLGGYFMLRRKAPKLGIGNRKVVRKFNVKVSKPVEKKPKFSFGKASESDIQDFRSRMIKDISDTQKKDKGSSGGMFNMFNK